MKRLLILAASIAALGPIYSAEPVANSINNSGTFIDLSKGTDTPADSSLKWDTTVLNLSATAQNRSIKGSFNFINRTDCPIVIESVKASCGCTTANFSPTIVKPGAGGIINLFIGLKGRRDPFDVSAIVSFKNGIAPQLLKCSVIPHGYIHVEPRILDWAHSEPHNAKTVSIDLTQAKELILENPSTLSDNNFSVTASFDVQNNLWKLSVLPKNSVPSGDILMLTFDAPDHGKKRQYFLALKTE